MAHDPPVLGTGDFSPEVQQLIDWFAKNYKDPANGVPHDSGEGGYQYVNGGPYDAEEELREQFPDASEGDIEAAYDHIHAFGWEWVRVDEY